MTKEIFGVDSLIVDHPASKTILEDARDALHRSDKPFLQVVIDATHSGLLTNRRVYPGRKVSKGFTSFFSKDNGGTAEFDKPILLHHEDHQDPVGRVTKATFTPLKQGADFDFDFANPDTEGKGSGVVTITGTILDREAIEKILDGRYISVSAGHSTDKFICSVCSDDLLGDKCEHIPGRTYTFGEDEDERQCYAIYNNITYHEVSFVNIPAQQAAKVVATQTTNDWWEMKGREGLEDKDRVVMGSSFAKKDSFREFVLRDSANNFSFDLLLGKAKDSRKKVVSMASNIAQAVSKELGDSGEFETPTVTKGGQSGSRTRKAASSDSVGKEGEETDDATDGRQDPNPPEPMDRDPDSLTNSNGERKVDKDKIELTQDEVKSAIDALRSENETLKSNRDELQKKVEGLEAALEGKDSEVKRLTEDLTNQQSEMAKVLATSLAHARIQLTKPGTEGIDTKEKLEEYISKLAERSIDSLKDSLADLAMEQNALEDGDDGNDTTKDDAAGKKVDSPALKKNREDKTTKGRDKRTATSLLEEELEISGAN